MSFMPHCQRKDCYLKKWMNRVNSSFVVLFLGLFFFSSWVFSAENQKDVPRFVMDFLKEDNLVVVDFYQNGFEKIDDFKGHYIVPPNHKNSSSHNLGNSKVFDGQFAHKAWMYESNEVIKGENTNHRAYPTLQMNKTPLGVVKTMVLIDLYVWVDIDLSKKEGENWLSLATFTSYFDSKWFRSYLVNVNSDYQMHLMHVPEQGVSRPDIYQSQVLKMPKKRWVRVTTLIDYSDQNRFDSPIIAVWQDGKLASASRFNDRINPYKVQPSRYPACLELWDKQDIKGAEELCGLNYLAGLAQMHFGLYAPPSLTSGEIYNDRLVVSELARKK